ncbi:CNP1-like family protein [Paludibacterium paludis]|uniref:Cryptic protein cnp1 n=1 Tax=Paludibacterium paludis TaxID=1225769 RepID=A0A918U8I0_9NEIS|nr:CNP1-like family protein [Paludibacterium paludis]GGY09370.1 cryptic protein cnp1 [Paludibacterium paludis]
MKKLVLLTGLCLLSAAASAEYKRHYNTNYALPDEGPWEESAYTLPAYPGAEGFTALDVPRTEGTRYLVEEKSLTITPDGVVHYVLKVVTPRGAENLSVEGLQCAKKRIRNYAFGDNVNKRWIESVNGAWRDWSRQDKVRVTVRETLCPDGFAPKSAEEAVTLLKKAAPRQ